MKDPIVITFDSEETARMYQQIQSLNFFSKSDSCCHYTYEMIYPLWESMMQLFLKQELAVDKES